MVKPSKRFVANIRPISQHCIRQNTPSYGIDPRTVGVRPRYRAKNPSRCTIRRNVSTMRCRCALTVGIRTDEAKQAYGLLDVDWMMRNTEPCVSFECYLTQMVCYSLEGGEPHTVVFYIKFRIAHFQILHPLNYYVDAGLCMRYT